MLRAYELLSGPCAIRVIPFIVMERCKVLVAAVALAPCLPLDSKERGTSDQGAKAKKKGNGQGHSSTIGAANLGVTAKTLVFAIPVNAARYHWLRQVFKSVIAAVSIGRTSFVCDRFRLLYDVYAQLPSCS